VINQMQDSHDVTEIFLWGTNQENLHADSSPVRHFDFDDIGFGSRRKKIRGRYIRDRRASIRGPSDPWAISEVRSSWKKDRARSQSTAL
jgi:hypothetical protein